MGDSEKPKLMGQVIQIYEARIRDHLDQMAGGAVEKPLYAILDAEQAQRPYAPTTIDWRRSKAPARASRRERR